MIKRAEKYLIECWSKEELDKIESTKLDLNAGDNRKKELEELQDIP